MDDSYNWRSVRSKSSFRLPKANHAGLWVGVAICIAILLHLVFLIAADQIKLRLGLYQENELVTDWLSLQRVEVEADTTYVDPVQPENVASEPPDSAQALLDELSLLDEIPKDLEMDISPQVNDPEFSLKLEVPTLDGSESSLSLEPVAGPETEAAVPELGNLEIELKESQNGRIIVDPGESIADEFDPDKLTRELARKGLESLSAEGVPEGFTSLDALLQLNGNRLTDEKGMIGSDLLFEFNESTLRESARLSLMKVAMLIDKNPEMFCWIEGHTDTIGSAAYNLKLSQRRGQSVKDWLVKSLALDPSQIIVIGRGLENPLIESGDRDAQALNRRVEIKMRKEPPVAVPILVTPEVEPERGIDTTPPVDDTVSRDPFDDAVVAVPVSEDELNTIPAEAVIESPPVRAVPVEEPLPSPQRADPVTE